MLPNCSLSVSDSLFACELTRLYEMTGRICNHAGASGVGGAMGTRRV